MPAIRSDRACLVGLNADLYVVEARVAQLLGATGGEAEPAGDQIRVQAKLIGALHQLDDVVALHRLAAGEVQLQHSELGGLGKHALPFLGRQLIAILVERERDWSSRDSAAGSRR